MPHARTPASSTTAAAGADALLHGDEAAFGRLTERHRRELHVHCYHMLGSLEDAEDAVQETLLRAWRRRETYQGRSTPRAWLYGIATNACLDTLAARTRRPIATTGHGARGAVDDADAPPPAELPWLQPYPDHLLEDLTAADDPEAVAVTRETIEIAFIAAIQHLPARQRAVLILRDLLDWPARDVAEVLGITVAAVNSALQRAHATMRRTLPAQRTEWAPGMDAAAAERELLRRYVEAHEQGDADALAALLAEDALQTMPPAPEWYRGRDAVAGLAAEFFGKPDFGDMRCVLTRANRQPAVAVYLRRPGDDRFRPMALDVLRIEDGLVASIDTFPPPVFARFGVPEAL